MDKAAAWKEKMKERQREARRQAYQKAKAIKQKQKLEAKTEARRLKDASLWEQLKPASELKEKRND